MPALEAAHNPPLVEGQTARNHALGRPSLSPKTGSRTSDKRLNPFRPPTQRLPCRSSKSAVTRSSARPLDGRNEVSTPLVQRYKPSPVPTHRTPCESVS